jgi:ribosomal protein S18 acetylase RimI-like enzyme
MATPAVNLKSVAPEQCPRLQLLVQELYAMEGITTPQETLRTALDKLLREPELGRAWFIAEGNGVVGYIILTFGYDHEYGGRDAWITDVYLRPEARGRGLATAALQQLDGIARNLGVCAMHLMVKPENRSALRTYKRAGFGFTPRTTMTKML